MFRFDFTPDQKLALELQFIAMQGQGYLTNKQADDVLRFLFDLPRWTEEDERREQEWLDRIAPTPEERARWHEEYRAMKEANRAQI